MLIVSVCKYRLHEEEFVRPVVELVKRFEDVSVVNAENVQKVEEKAIICGTALKDFDYLGRDFSWILDFDFVLGICAGYQVIARLFSAELVNSERIGVYEVECVSENPLFDSNFKAYFLHELAVRECKNLKVLARVKDDVAAFKVRKREFYGLAFHPEVLNPEIIEKFCRL